jgi:serine/threonine protein kinase
MPPEAPWIVGARVARGGSCEVLRGEDPRTREPVAIKALLRECARDAGVRASFTHEATLLAQRDPTSSPRLLAQTEHDGRPALVMTWLDAQPLDGIRDRRSPSEALTLCAQLLRALHGLHTLSDARGPLAVVHRDVNPSNTLVSPQGRLSLVDLGLASSRLLPRSANGLSEGTIGYHAPELISGADPVDARADLFSTGIVLWELLAARRLFPRDRFAAARAIVDDDAPDVREARPDVPAPLALALARALARAPRERFPDARAFALALRDATR